MPDFESFPVHPLDVVAGFLLLYSMYRGYRTGLIRVIINTVALLLALVFAFTFLNEAKEFLSDYMDKDSFLMPLIAFVLVLAACFFGLKWFSALVSKMVKASLFGPLDQAGGAIFGLFRMALILGSCLYALDLVGVNIETEGELLLLPALKKTGPAVIGVLSPLLPFLQEIKET